MTDIEITKACAASLGFEGNDSVFVSVGRVIINDGGNSIYDPLHDDAQCFALVKKFGLWLRQFDGKWHIRHVETDQDILDENLNRAICECVAKMRNDIS